MSFKYEIQKKLEGDKGQITVWHTHHIKNFRNCPTGPGKPEKNSTCGLT